MYIQRNRSKYKSGKGYRSFLLCKKYRQDGKIKAKTLANLSHLQDELILSIGNTLKSKTETVINVTTLKIPKLNQIQRKLFEILNLNPNQMLPTAQ